MNEQTLTNRIVGGLSYLAVLFLPVLFSTDRLDRGPAR